MRVLVGSFCFLESLFWPAGVACVESYAEARRKIAEMAERRLRSGAGVCLHVAARRSRASS